MKYVDNIKAGYKANELFWEQIKIENPDYYFTAIIGMGLILLLAVGGVFFYTGVNEQLTDHKEYGIGLKQGWGEGFISGQQYGIGQAMGVLSPENRWENATWYYQEGFKRGTITGYQTNESLNPYKSKR